MNNKVILIAEDEAPIRKFVIAGLSSDEYKVIEALSAKEAVQSVATNNPDLLLLDLGLPDMDGLTVIQRVREWSNIPIIVVSARGQEKDKISALDSGADDYLTKPFSLGELLARMRVAFRNSSRIIANNETKFQLRDLCVDFTTRQVTIRGEQKHLTPTEYKLLCILIKYAGRVVTHKLLLTEVWGQAYARQTQYLRVYMQQLRHKIEEDPSRPIYLGTDPGIGYKLRME